MDEKKPVEEQLHGVIACGRFGPKGERACWDLVRESYEELAKRKGWLQEEDDE